MIGYLPKLYDDELLYSFIARYHKYTLHRSPKTTSKDLFGKKQIAVPDLPINLVELNNRTDFFLNIGLSNLIKHTLCNYYTNFTNEETKNYVREAMIKGIPSKAIHIKSGIMASVIKEKEYFYFCSMCNKENLKEFGELYWHLLHQIPGVYICITHTELLKKSTVSFRSRSRYALYPASEKNCKIRDVELNYRRKTIDKLVVIAKESNLLTLNEYNFDINRVQISYKTLLKRKGMVTLKGMINQEKLAREFELFYGKELLQLLQSEICYLKSSCWLKAITRKHRKSFHPIRHILFIHFLGESVETINDLDTQKTCPFGVGPFLCLNKASDHFGKKVIPEVELYRCSKTEKTVGAFKCICGFHYTRIDSDNPYQRNRIIKFGDIWIHRANDLIYIQKMSYRAAARELNVDTKTLIKYSKIQPVKNKTDLLKGKEIIIEMKQDWLKLIAFHPLMGVTQLRKLNPSLYMKLYRSENIWLKKNSPKQEREKGNDRVDWQLRDEQLAISIKIAALKLLNIEPPRRVTISSIGNEIGHRSLLERHINKLPECKKVLNKYVEEKNSFQIRRIKYVVDKFEVEHKEIVEWKIKRFVGYKATQNICVMNTINEHFLN